jgi:hypothetical protein
MIKILIFDQRRVVFNNTIFFLLITLVFFLLSSPLFAQTRTSVQSGNWSNKNTWDCNCVPATTESAVVATGHTVTFNSSNTIKNLTINTGGIITDNGQDNTITGNLIINGTYSGSGKIILTGTNTTLDGSGSISNTASIEITTGNKTIASTASLTKNTGDLNITGALAVTNNGTITIAGNIAGSVSGSTWTNSTNATLNIGTALLTTGILNASASGNTINYYGSVAQTIKSPSSVSGQPTYYHLTASGSNNKTLPSVTLYVEGNVTISATLNGNGSTKILHVRGNWVNSGNFTEGSGTVFFDGTTDQSITRSAGDENFNNLTINKSTGTLTLNTNVIIGTSSNLTAASTLTMTAGNINAGIYTVTLGKGSGTTAAYAGALAYTSGFIIGEFKRFVNTTGSNIIFPIGTASNSRAATVYFNNLVQGSLTAKFNSSSPGKNGLPLTESGITLYNSFRDGYWSLTAAEEDSLASTDYNLELTGNGFTGFSVVSNTRLLTRSGSANAWTLNGVHATAVGNVVKRLNITTLSGEYAFGDITNCTAPSTSTITGTTEICKSAIGEIYSVTNNILNTYAWSVTGGTIASGQGTNSVTVNWGSTGITGNVSVVETNLCTTGADINLAVNVNPIPPTSITGKANVPQNGATSVTYSTPAKTNYTFTWTVSGGTIASGQGTTSIAVNWGSAGTGSVCVVGNHSTCGTSSSTCTSISIYTVISSVQSGNWSQASVWDCSCTPGTNDNVTIKNTHTVALNVNNKIINHLNINSGGTLNTGTRALTINGDFSVNGTLSGTGALTLGGTNTNIDGTGNVSNSAALNITAGKTILTSTSLSKTAGDINLSAGVIVTNNGTITFGGNLIGGDATSTWINAANSTLNIGGALFATGILSASATGNTIHYTGAIAQSIKTPSASQYYHLSYSGTGIKTAPAATMLIGGSFTCDGTLAHNNGSISFNGTSSILGTTIPNFYRVTISGTLTSASGSINIAENFINNGTFSHNNGTVNFNGTSAISGTTSLTQFKNITISGTLTSPANLYVGGDFKNDGAFTHNNGTVNFNGTTNILGSAITNFYNISNTGTLISSSQTVNVGGNFINSGTFTHNSGTIAFNGTSSITGSVNPTFYNITISDILNSPNILLVAGDLTNNGTFNADTGSVKFAGNRTQYVKGTAITNFNDITVSNISVPSVSIETGQNLLGILLLEIDTRFDADGSLDSATFTLVSQSDSLDAKIATIPSGASVIGKVKVQRYMSGEGRIYRYLSSPVTNATVADWMDDFPITGNFKDPSAYPVWPKIICGSVLVPKSTSMYYYDETKPGAASSGYVAYPNSNTYAASNSLQVGKGYVPFIRQCSSATTIDVKGPVNQGTISIPVTYTNTVNDAVASVGWNLVGNPYPSTIDWNLEGDQNNNGDSLDVVDGWSKVNIAAAIAIEDNGSGMVRYWDGDGDNGLTEIPLGVIATGQGFWVRATGASPQLTIREGVKSTSNAEYFRKQTIPAIIISLRQGTLEDKAFVKLRPTSKETLDYWDAPKLNNELFDIATLSSDNLAMAINAIPSLNCQSTIKVKLTDLTKGFYTFKISSHGEFDHQYSLTVYDNYTKVSKPLQWNEEISIEVNDNAASKAADRLVLYVNNARPENVITETTSNLCHADGNIKLSHSQGDIFYSVWSQNEKLLTSNIMGNDGVLMLHLSIDSLTAGENNLVVKGQNLCGIFQVSDPILITVEHPVIDQVLNGKSCLAGAVELSASSSGNGTFRWYTSADAQASIFEGQQFETPVLEKSKTYYVNFITALGCESERRSVVAMVINYDMPTIMLDGDLLRNSYTENVQWYFNNAIIAGATSSTYRPQSSGKYSAVTTIEGCEAQADFEYLVTGMESSSEVLLVYPNPAIDKFVVNIPSSFGTLRSVYLTSSEGVHIPADIYMKNDQLILNVESMVDGLYILNLEFEDSTSRMKIVKSSR